MPPKRLLFYLLLILSGATSFSQQPKLLFPIGHTRPVLSAAYSPDGKKIITVGVDGTAKLWEAATGKLLKDIKAGGDASITFVLKADFIHGGKRILVEYEGLNNVKIFDATTGANVSEAWHLNYQDAQSITKLFDKNGDNVLADTSTTPGETRMALYSLATGKKVSPFFKASPVYFDKYVLSPDGKKMVTCGEDSSLRVYDVASTSLLKTFRIHTAITVNEVAVFSPDNKNFLLAVTDSDPEIINITTGKRTILKGDSTIPGMRQYFRFNHDGTVVYRLSSDGPGIQWSPLNDYYEGLSITGWNTTTGKLVKHLNQLSYADNAAFMSPDGKKILAALQDSTVLVMNAGTGQKEFLLSGFSGIVKMARFNKEGKQILVVTSDNSVSIWNALTGKMISNQPVSGLRINDASLSPDNKYLLMACQDGTVKICQVGKANVITELKGRTNNLERAWFTPDGKKIIVKSSGRYLQWNIEKGNISRVYPDANVDSGGAADPYHPYGTTPRSADGSKELAWGADIINVTNNNGPQPPPYWSGVEDKEIYYDVRFSPDSKKLLAVSANNVLKLFDIKTSQPILTFVSIDSTDFLVADAEGRYDGTDAARKLLYYTCGTEVIELQQVKEQLWVPGLAQRVNNFETVNGVTLKELGLCGLTPAIEDFSNKDNYYFKIKPGRGGVGETAISVNGIRAFTFQPQELQKETDGYAVRIKKEVLSSFFTDSEENTIAVTALTSDGAVSSRRLLLTEDPGKEKREPPQFFGIMVGVSDYKGSSIDLNYAAKDAVSLAETIAASATKLLGKEKVHIYNMVTQSGKTFPEKKAIKKVFDEVAAQAKPNDILFIFLSGHGVMNDKDKQFYFMTSEASSLTDETLYKAVGISMTELTDWIKPQLVKAQKRILILDACNSGQAINDLIKTGLSRPGLLAVKGDGGAQLKAIERLNEKSGLFVLSASASSQSAFESDAYEHGYLTYALLKTVKEKPDVLENGKYLNVSRWFNTAAQAVSALANQESLSKQEPQVVSNTDFNVGLVDKEIIEGILLKDILPLFGPSAFQNADETADGDNLSISRLMNEELAKAASKESERTINYNGIADNPGSYTLSGRYDVIGDNIFIRVNLKRNNIVEYRIQEKGSKDNEAQLVKDIIGKVLVYMKK